LLGAKSILRLNGNELDDKANLMQSGFVFNNLNVKETCRCGTPFSTEQAKDRRRPLACLRT